MSNKYTPRRAGKRWREGAPDYILDCFDDPRTIDRYTVLLGGSLLNGTTDGTKVVVCSYAAFNQPPPWIDYIGMSGAPEDPQGFSQMGELSISEMQNYRYRNGHYRIKWLDLPEHIRQHVIARCTED